MADAASLDALRKRTTEVIKRLEKASARLGEVLGTSMTENITLLARRVKDSMTSLVVGTRY